MLSKKIKVLIIDDSALVRDILKKGLSEDKSLEVVGAAPDVYVGRDMIKKHRPNVLTLDIEMPRMDGIQFLKRLMPQFPIPTVVVSSLTQRGQQITIEALEAGAVDFVPKPTSNVAKGLQDMLLELRTKIKLASTANVSHWKTKSFNLKQISSEKTKALANSTDKLIAIGASTGGTEAIKNVIYTLPPTTPGIVVVQHMPKLFTKTFADRLNQESRMKVKEAEDGDRILNGWCYIAPGDYHLKVVRSGGQYLIKILEGEKVNGHRPAVDFMFDSVASSVGRNAYGIILTGMGSDGAKGLVNMKNAGAKTIGQDEASSVVYGMPKVAFDIGGVGKQLPLEKIPGELIRLLNKDLIESGINR